MKEPGAPTSRSFFSSWAFKAPLIIVVILVLLWVISEFAIPPIASSVAKNEIKKKYPEAQDVTVSIKAFPALKIAFKKYDSLTVSVGAITLQGVKFDRIVLKSNEWPQGAFTALLGQEEIARFFSLKNSYITDPKLTLTDNGVAINGKVGIGSKLVAVSATGQLAPVGGKMIYFKPADVQVAGIVVPGQGVTLVRQVMEQNPVFMVREDLPYTITGISAKQGKLEITGLVDLEKALSITL